MRITRRTSLTLAAAAIGTGALPQIALSQGPADTFRYPVDGGTVIFHPVDHSSMVIDTPNGVIHVDPVGGADK